jgi:hypothetical protein
MIVDPEHLVKADDRRHGGDYVGFKYHRRQFEHRYARSARPESPVDGKCGDPHLRIAADHHDSLDAPAQDIPAIDKS